MIGSAHSRSINTCLGKQEKTKWTPLWSACSSLAGKISCGQCRTCVCAPVLQCWERGSTTPTTSMQVPARGMGVHAACHPELDTVRDRRRIARKATRKRKRQGERGMERWWGHGAIRHEQDQDQAAARVVIAWAWRSMASEWVSECAGREIEANLRAGAGGI